MRPMSSAELLVPIPVARLLDRPLTPLPGPVQLHLDDGWLPAHWTSTVLAHRRKASWRRGRIRGTATIDLLPAGPSSTLLVIELARLRRFPRLSSKDVDALRLARLVRDQLTSPPDPARLGPVIRVHHRRESIASDVPVRPRALKPPPSRPEPTPSTTAQPGQRCG